jgi:hypothetical protein
MGAEARCTATCGGRKAEGKALLETDELIFRGDSLRLSIFELGAAAMTWIDKIRNPPRRIGKLGIKTGQKVLFVGLRDTTLRDAHRPKIRHTGR